MQLRICLETAGVKPNSEIDRDAGVELGPANAIRVDEHMTNIPAALKGRCGVVKFCHPPSPVIS
jgi:hypothetical protein